RAGAGGRHQGTAHARQPRRLPPAGHRPRRHEGAPGGEEPGDVRARGARGGGALRRQPRGRGLPGHAPHEAQRPRLPARPAGPAARALGLPQRLRPPGPGRPAPLPAARRRARAAAGRRPGGAGGGRGGLRVERAGAALVGRGRRGRGGGRGRRRGRGGRAMILDLAQRRAELTPDAPAVRFAGRWYAYAELNERATRLANLLAARGVGRGDRVSIVAQNHLAHLDLILATAKLGFVYAPLNTRLALPEQEAIGAYLRPSLVLHDEPNAERGAAAARGAGAASLALEGYEAALAASPAAPLPDPGVGPEDTQMVLLTGGTTGLPKGAMLPYRQGFYNAVNTVFSWGLRPDDCVVQATPAFHAAVNVFTLPLLHLGAR